jgi:hypothetical protein
MALTQVQSGMLASGVPTRAQLPAGSVLQVVSTTKTDTFTSTSTSYVDITGLSLSITPTSSSSRVVLIANVEAVESTSNTLYLRFVRDSTPIAVGDAAGVRVQATGGIRYPIGDGGGVGSIGMSFLDSPSTTSATTYKIQIAVQGGTGCVNRSFEDIDNVGRGRYVSTITAMEVAV